MSKAYSIALCMAASLITCAAAVSTAEAKGGTSVSRSSSFTSRAVVSGPVKSGIGKSTTVITGPIKTGPILGGPIKTGPVTGGPAKGKPKEHDHRGRFYAYASAPVIYATYAQCGWLKARALETGSPRWWARYEACRDGE